MRLMLMRTLNMQDRKMMDKSTACIDVLLNEPDKVVSVVLHEASE